MPSLPEAMLPVLFAFAPLFSRPVWGHVRVLLVGAVLGRGPRTVPAAFRVMGLGQEQRGEKYHRGLSRARWSGLQGAKRLLGFLVPLLPSTWPLVVGVDATVERRQGANMAAKGCSRDAVRSSASHVVTCCGLTGLSMRLIVPVPWSPRPWAVPFLTGLAPSQRANETAGKRHKTTRDWTIQMVQVVSRWLGGRPWMLLGDGSSACVRLAWACLGHRGGLISRVRLEAQGYAVPAPVPAGRRGRKPRKGPRLPALHTLGDATKRAGHTVAGRWDGGERQRVRMRSDVCLWSTPGEQPVPLRWVLVVDPDGTLRPQAFFSTDLLLAPATLVAWFVLRWNVEGTFEEGRRHLGVDTHRQWSPLAIARTPRHCWGSLLSGV